MLFAPTASETAADAEPEVTVTPFTFTVEYESVTVGVSDIDVVSFATDAVYDRVEELNEGVIVRPDVVSDDKVARDDVASSCMVNQSLLPLDTK